MTPIEFFENDRFAREAGIRLTDVRPGFAKACVTIGPQHLNAGGRTQGGLLFTLADLVVAAAANAHGTLAFSLSAHIGFVRGTGAGDTLWAEARERHKGRTTGTYQVDITRQDGKLVATFEATMYVMDTPLPLDPA